MPPSLQRMMGSSAPYSRIAEAMEQQLTSPRGAPARAPAMAFAHLRALERIDCFVAEYILDSSCQPRFRNETDKWSSPCFSFTSFCRKALWMILGKGPLWATAVQLAMWF